MELVIVISPYSRIIPLPRPLTRIATLTAQGIIAPLFLHRPRPRDGGCDRGNDGCVRHWGVRVVRERGDIECRVCGPYAGKFKEQSTDFMPWCLRYCIGYLGCDRKAKPDYGWRRLCQQSGLLQPEAAAAAIDSGKARQKRRTRRVEDGPQAERPIISISRRIARMQESIDLGKSDEATAQVAQLGELAGELIGCGCARSATSLKSISFYRDWFHCSSPAAAGCQSTASRSHPPVPIDMDACPLARASPCKVDSRHLEHASPGHQPSFPPDELHPNKLVLDDRMLCLAVGLHKWR
ncbi:uncharacterized protein BO96DRAFT_396342 [Aspergillus niger CBS 101883]|uniref:Uncharacterized protein n=2 Tax=Aspergillus niger TaxID=5061 RepID=A2QG21_ASPNC|nr:uncharacterized protein BO96DRAFT_396342 [Aspergillus niger CBS 101883]XP_059600228.1 hypothetical protein An03g01580 [Aspergillus niger]PYH55134.1 hypothetical protein BO96DRAFT_396342 [Aspergillus niger CBS 101883]CAK38131.1 hypothetical protein An03g01580 [Aspergillus niger]